MAFDPIRNQKPYCVAKPDPLFAQSNTTYHSAPKLLGSGRNLSLAYGNTVIKVDELKVLNESRRYSLRVVPPDLKISDRMFGDGKEMVAKLSWQNEDRGLRREFEILELLQARGKAPIKTFGYDENARQAVLLVEYFSGRTLEEFLCMDEYATGMPVNWAIDIIHSVCCQLKEAEALGISHGDVLTKNIMSIITDHGHVRTVVIDFGLAKIPSEIFDRRTDILALGIIFHDLLTGRNPFSETSVGERADLVALRIEKGIVILENSLDPQVKRIIRKMLVHPRLSKGYFSYAEIINDIEKLKKNLAAKSGLSFPA